MSTSIEITCFTDLKGSTDLTEALGHQEFIPILQEHLRIGKSLAARNNGKYVKNIGDAHMVRFIALEDALGFASQLQQLCCSIPGMVEQPIPVRVSLFQGAVEPSGTDADVFGSGVNQAARLQGFTDPGSITVNEAIYRTMQTAFGKQRCEQLCTSLGSQSLKGIEGEQHLYSFQWQQYTRSVPNASIALTLYDHFREAGIEPSNVTASDVNRPGLVIWPVVPRDLATAIHRAQIEVIRLLSLIGWQVTVLIADCGGETEYTDEYVEAFQRCLNAHLVYRQISVKSIVRMSAVYEPSYENYKHVQALFRRISSQMTVDVLMAINTKKYAKDVQAAMAGKPTLTYLRPPLTLAAVLHLAEGVGSKCAVVAGSDEELQWGQAYNAPSGRERLGVLMIPVVKMDPEHQMHQQRAWPIWHSEAEVVRSTAGSNVAWWLFRLLAFLPAFPDRVVKVGDSDWKPSQWSDEIVTPSGFDVPTLVKDVWPLLTPA